jgi:hypothetical protein
MLNKYLIVSGLAALSTAAPAFALTPLSNTNLLKQATIEQTNPIQLPTTTKLAQWQTSWAIRVCRNYMAAGYGQGRLIRALQNRDNSISCDTTQVSFMISERDARYWGYR